MNYLLTLKLATQQNNLKIFYKTLAQLKSNTYICTNNNKQNKKVMPKLTTITEKNISKKVEQFTLHNLLNNRASLIGKGHQNIKVDTDFFDKSIEQIVCLIGGRNETKCIIDKVLTFRSINGWFLERFYYCNITNRWRYGAGQDHTAEIKDIRNTLKKLW